VAVANYKMLKEEDSVKLQMLTTNHNTKENEIKVQKWKGLPLQLEKVSPIAM
jgi:hypothetical protein